jgi:phage-related protein
MEKPIDIIFLKNAEDFLDELEESARKKLFQCFRKTKERIFGQWFSKLAGSDGIFEFRIEDGGKFYRLFAFWDNESSKETLVVCTHGFLKKTNKTPKNEIEKAEKIKKEYFASNN